MSARVLLQAALVAALRARPAFADIAVFDAPPVRAATPHAIIEEPVFADWSTKDWRGHDGRIAIVLRDGGERPERLRALTGEVADAIASMPAALGEGWRVVALRPERERIMRSGADRWTATSEFAVRLYHEN